MFTHTIPVRPCKVVRAGCLKFISREFPNPTPAFETHAEMADKHYTQLTLPGIVSMARGGSRDSGTSSFFIMYGSAPHLDMEYGAFG